LRYPSICSGCILASIKSALHYDFVDLLRE
jgi:hypothetical protein